MKWKAFGIVLAAALAVPFAALAGNNLPPPGTSSGSSPSSTPAAKAHAHWFAGAVTTAGSGSVTVHVLWTGKHDTQLNGQNVTVAVDSSTEIHYGKGKSSIEPGDLVGVRASGTDLTSLTAKRINVRCNCHFAAGTLDSISGSQVTIHVERTGPYDTVLKGNDVTFQLGSAAASANTSTNAKVAVVFSADGFFKDPSFDWQNATFTVLRLRYRA